MQVEVRVFATLRQFAPQLWLTGKTLEIDSGTTLRQLMHQLNLPEEQVKIVMRNHRRADLNEEIHDGDRVAYIPAVAGG